jgi:hypothetical protein
VAARGAGEEDGVAACGAGDGAARGAGEEVIAEGRGDASGAQVEAPKDGPADKNLCGDPIGASTVSNASKNSRVAGVEGPSCSAKGNAVSSKMTCQGSGILCGEQSNQERHTRQIEE